MRDFFIISLEKVINVIMVLSIVALLLVTAAVGFGGGMMGPDGMHHGGPLAGLAIFVGGAVYLIIFGGFMYLGLGIYDNTKRTAEAVEKMQQRA